METKKILVVFITLLTVFGMVVSPASAAKTAAAKEMPYYKIVKPVSDIVISPSTPSTTVNAGSAKNGVMIVTNVDTEKSKKKKKIVTNEYLIEFNLPKLKANERAILWMKQLTGSADKGMTIRPYYGKYSSSSTCWNNLQKDLLGDPIKGFTSSIDGSTFFDVTSIAKQGTNVFLIEREDSNGVKANRQNLFASSGYEPKKTDYKKNYQPRIEIFRPLTKGPGDFNENGKYDFQDVKEISRYVQCSIGFISIPKFVYPGADVDGNGYLDISDLNRITELANGK